MIALARRKAPAATFVVGSLQRVDLPHCDAVTAIGECFAYSFDATGSLDRLFHRIHRVLRPGGVLVFDFAEPGVAGPEPRRSWFEGEGWAVLAEARERRGRLERRIVTYRRHGTVFRRTEETHRLRLYESADLLKQLTVAGFDARSIDAYGRLRMLPGRKAILATREP
jgi:SAM-dependent methyltransferase